VNAVIGEIPGIPSPSKKRGPHAIDVGNLENDTTTRLRKIDYSSQQGARVIVMLEHMHGENEIRCAAHIL